MSWCSVCGVEFYNLWWFEYCFCLCGTCRHLYCVFVAQAHVRRCLQMNLPYRYRYAAVGWCRISVLDSNTGELRRGGWKFEDVIGEGKWFGSQGEYRLQVRLSVGFYLSKIWLILSPAVTWIMSDLDDDGPCAFPQPKSIDESMADPLATLGFMLISLSFILALIYFTTDDQNNNRWVASAYNLNYKT